MAEPSDPARADAVAGVASALLSETVLEPPRPTERGWGNENWLVRVPTGAVLFKIASARADLDKLRAAWVAHGLVHRAGVPTGRPLCFVERCDELDGTAVRLVEFVDGAQPESVLSTPDAVRRFFASLGEAVARLHGISFPVFTSRVDRSAPEFDRWGDYVTYRLGGVVERALAAGVFSERDLRPLLADIGPLAESLSAVVAPALTHRDLYLDNVLAGRDGQVCALVDWDTAEAWDPVVDLVKLRWQVFDRFPGASEAFRRAYDALAAPFEMLRERLYVVDVLELVNTVANARLAGWVNFEEQSRFNLTRAVADYRA
jgi:aminoglycoside phosphotransferase (APT) family kinase protein